MEDFGYFLVEIIEKEPVPCTEAEGVTAEGTVIWTGNQARYIYIKEEGTRNPGVPPNNDNPEGTLWRLDVRSNQEALPSGVAYGDKPEGSKQITPPNNAAPPALESGKNYHLYVLEDILLPIANCIFQAP